MPQPLLTTKLYIPRSSARTILRQEIVDHWVKNYDASKKVTLICAPAGYGKTTLMLDLIAAANAACAWLSLDEDDSDTKRFLSYLCAAFEKIAVPISEDLRPLLQDASFQAPEALLTMLIGSIAEYDQNILLVLDDYHAIRNLKVHSLMQFLLTHQPPKLHIAILTREDPPLPLSRIRLHEELIELRADDLKFQETDTARLLHQSPETAHLESSACKITSLAVGWAAGIKLYALALKGRSNTEAAEYIDQLSGTHAYIIDYLVEEVLLSQPEDVRSFLQKTSILTRMDGALCDALTGQISGAEMLREVSRRNLFLTAMDDKREWFRYHPLFADAIRAGLSKTDERLLYVSASVHMKARGFVNEAVAYAFKSGDMQIALKMVEDSTEEAFRTAQLETLLYWLKALPDALVKNSEILCVRRPIACFITGRMEEALTHVAALGPDFENTASKHNLGLLLCIRAMVASATGQDAQPLAENALSLLEPWDPIARTSAFNTLGRAQFKKGNVHAAAQTFENALASSLRLGYQFVTTLVVMNYSSCLGIMGKYREAIAKCESFIEGMAASHGLLPPYAGILYVTMAGFYKALGEREKAEALKTKGEALCKSISYDVSASLKMYEVPVKPPQSETLAPAAMFERLSEREAEILHLLNEGLSNGDIAKKLFISTNTTQWHISHLYGKLGVKSRTQAIAKARELQLLWRKT